MDTPEYIAETGWVDQAKSITELRLEQTSSSRSSHIVCPSHFRPHIGAVQKYCFPPAEDTLLFVCGLPPMYNALCGPRTEKELKEGTVLHSLGYTTDRTALDLKKTRPAGRREALDLSVAMQSAQSSL